jgi:hypothetical protein
MLGVWLRPLGRTLSCEWNLLSLGAPVVVRVGEVHSSDWSRRCMRCTSAVAGGDVEAERGVGGQTLGVHSLEDRDTAVDVVVKFDVGFAFVLDDSTSEGERKGEEERVELGPVEALTEIRAGSDEDDAHVRVAPGDGVVHSGSGFLAEAAAKHEGAVTEVGESRDDELEVVGSLCEDKAGATGFERGMDVGADVRGPNVVGDEGVKDGLNVGRVLGWVLCRGLVNDELSSDELSAGNGPGFDLVSGGAALEGDDGFEPVSSVRGGGQTEPSSRSRPLDAGREAHGGEVVTLVDDDEPVPVEE